MKKDDPEKNKIIDDLEKKADDLINKFKNSDDLEEKANILANLEQLINQLPEQQNKITKIKEPSHSTGFTKRLISFALPLLLLLGHPEKKSTHHEPHKIEKTISGIDFKPPISQKLDKAVVCMFHGIYKKSQPPSYRNTYHVNIKALINKIDKMREMGYNFVTISKIGEHIKNHEKFSQPTVALVFDDGLKSHYDIAELLFNRGLKATFAIPISSINTKGHLEKNEIKEIASMGHEIAGHSYSHDLPQKESLPGGSITILRSGYLNRKPNEPIDIWHHRLIFEIKKSYNGLSDIIKGIIKEGIKTYVFVGGEHGTTEEEKEKIVEVLRNVGFEYGVIIGEQPVDINNTSQYFIPRIIVGDINIEQLDIIVERMTKRTTMLAGDEHEQKLF